jgi:hypothetical protein
MALTVVCVLAVWRGRDEERLAAGTVVLAWALSMVVYRDSSEATQWQVLAIDSGVFAVYMWLAMRSRRYWPLFAAGFKLLALVTHLAHAVDESISGWAYWTAARVFNYLALFTIGYGAWTAPRHAVRTEDPIDAAGATRR